MFYGINKKIHYLCVEFRMIMAELKQFTLTQLKQLIDGNDDALTNSYISQNLAIARKIKPKTMLDQFSHEAMVAPEMRILILRKGWAEPTINLTPRHFEAGDLVFLGRNGIVHLGQIADETEGMGISISDDLFSLAIGNRIPKAFDGHLRDFHFRLEPNEIEFLDQLHLLLCKNTRKEGHSSQVTLHLLSTFLWYVDHLWSRHEEASRQSQSREQQLFSDFIQLLSRDVAREHQVDYYASQLCLSTRYVSTLIKKVSGRAAKEWIDDALISRIKIELKHSNKSIAQISDEMNFPNPSFFSKYFKRETGMTPGRYRET